MAMTRTIYRTISFAVCLLGIFLIITGCGGGGADISSVEFARAKVPISWALRSMAIGGPSSALSVVVTFDQAGPSRQDVSIEADRNGSPAAYRQIYETSQRVRAGVQSIHVWFYSQAGAQGSLVAQADASVLVKDDGSLAKVDGSPLGSIQATGQIKSVLVTGPKVVSIGTPQPIGTFAIDPKGYVIGVSSGSVFFQIENGNGAATVDSTGRIVGTSAGTVMVVATIDGVSSVPTAVTVLPAAQQTLAMTTLAQATSDIAVDPATGNLWAAIPATDSKYGNSVVEIDPSSHKIISSMPVGSSPNVMAFSDDGSALYVGLQGTDSFVRLDPIAKKVVATYPVISAESGNSQYALYITVQPGNPDVVALCQQNDQDSGFDSGCIYHNGVLLNSKMGFYNGYLLGFSNPTTLWSSNPGWYPQSLFEATVDGSGATLTSNNSGMGGLFSIFGGNLYFANGQVVSGTTGSLLGTYPVQIQGQGVAIDFTSETAYIIGQFEGAGPYQVSSFGAGDYKSSTIYAVPNGPTAVNRFMLLKSGQFVFSDAKSVYFLQQPVGQNASKQPRQTRH